MFTVSNLEFCQQSWGRWRLHEHSCEYFFLARSLFVYYMNLLRLIGGWFILWYNPSGIVDHPLAGFLMYPTVPSCTNVKHTLGSLKVLNIVCSLFVSKSWAYVLFLGCNFRYDVCLRQIHVSFLICSVSLLSSKCLKYASEEDQEAGVLERYIGLEVCGRHAISLPTKMQAVNMPSGLEWRNNVHKL